jgi:hypothetical protein
MWAVTIDGRVPRCRVCGEALPEALYRLQEHARCEAPRSELTSFALGQSLARWLAPRRAQVQGKGHWTREKRRR